LPFSIDIYTNDSFHSQKLHVRPLQNTRKPSIASSNVL
jgi:hypothetical protein